MFKESVLDLNKFKGYLLAAFAAAAYGTNPAFAIPLYEEKCIFFNEI